MEVKENNAIFFRNDKTDYEKLFEDFWVVLLRNYGRGFENILFGQNEFPRIGLKLIA